MWVMFVVTVGAWLSVMFVVTGGPTSMEILELVSAGVLEPEEELAVSDSQYALCGIVNVSCCFVSKHGDG